MISGHQEFFFLAIWWAGYFFLFFSHKLSITFVLHAIFFVRQALAGNFFSKSPTRRTLVVIVSHPRFTVKPPMSIFAVLGDTLTLNCSATGDPQPVISWRKQGSHLPVGRNQQINGAFVIRDISKNDTGYYICTATSAGVFGVKTLTHIQVYPTRGQL